MCAESTTWLLAVSLESDILSRVKDAEEAQRLLDEYKRCSISRVSLMAERYFEEREQHHLVQALADTGKHHETKLSMIRGAIKMVLAEHIRTCEQGTPSVFLEPSFA